MAGTKGKVGGRKIKDVLKENNCDKCSELSQENIRVKSYNSKGKARMMWLCKKCFSG